MEIRVLGAHNCESLTTSCVCFLIDGKLAIDAGALTSNLSIKEQQNLEAILLTHHHYDHIRDLPGIALNCSIAGARINIYSSADVRTTIETHLLNGSVYPRFQEVPRKRPSIVLNVLKPFEPRCVDGHQVMAVPVRHFGNTVGYQVMNAEGSSVFYTADTGPGLVDLWQRISPGLLIIDVTWPNDHEEFARKTGHLTPVLLERELLDFRKCQGYLPRVVAVHMDAGLESQIREELKAVAKRLGIPITVGHEGMRLKI